MKYKIKTKEPYYIYCLKCPMTLKIMYIGVTTQPLRERLYKHIYESKKRSLPKNIWINNLLKLGKRPLICLITICNNRNYIQEEILQIKRNNKLLNIRRGGSGLIKNRSKESIMRSATSKYRRIVGFTEEKKPIYFNSIKEATIKLSIPKNNIAEVLSKRSNSARGYYFIYEEDFTEDFLNNFNQKIKKFEKFKILLDNTECNIEQASIILGCSKSIISMYINGMRDFKRSKFFKNGHTLHKIMI